MGVFSLPHTPFFIRMLSPRTKINLRFITFKLIPELKLSHEVEVTEEKYTGTEPHYYSFWKIKTE